MALSADRRFRLVNDYAGQKGYFAGFPNFHEADYGQGVVGGVHLLTSAVAEWRDVPRATYGVYHIEDVPALFRAAATYAASQGYPGAFPNCHQQDYGSGVVYGTILMKPGMAEWRDVLRSDLGNPSINDVGAMMRAAADYATAQGYAAAFPTFHQANHGAGVVYGVVLIPQGNAAWLDVLISDLYLMDPHDEPTCIVLCRFRDGNGQLTPTIADADFYRSYFFGRGNQGLRDYYADVTHGHTNLVGDVFDWLDIGHTLAEHSAVGGQTQRVQAFNWGLTAARAAGIAVDTYPRQVVVVNASSDWGGVNRGRSMLLPDSADATWDHARAMHEFGHVLGLDDSFSTTTDAAGNVVDTRYQDFHCIMSYATTGSRYRTTFLGRSMEAGPGLNGVYANQLGGIPLSRLHVVPALGANRIVNLAPLGHPEEDGDLLAQIPPTLARPKTYWVEFHDRSDWDRAIPNSRVAVHETRAGSDGAFMLSVNGVGSLGAPGDPALVTPDGSIGIYLSSRSGRNATVRIWELGPTHAEEVRFLSVVVNPPDDDALDERVVIRNDRRTVVALAGWTLQDESNHPSSAPWTYRFPAVSLEPGADMTVWTKAGRSDASNLYWGLNHAVWNNKGGDAAILRNDRGDLIARLAW
jgi:Lamin Tail Domain